MSARLELDEAGHVGPDRERYEKLVEHCQGVHAQSFERAHADADDPHDQPEAQRVHRHRCMHDCDAGNQ